MAPAFLTIRSRATVGDEQLGALRRQGLGLAVVQEIVELYGGELVISRSPLGDAAVEVRL